MTVYQAHHLKGDKRTLEYKVWSEWFQHVLKLKQQYHDKVWEGGPFVFNEVASVGVLAAGASLSGLISQMEYHALKKQVSDGRKKALGRADLWIYSEPHSWSFEFKQLSEARYNGGAKLQSSLTRAISDAKRLTKQEADRFFGGLIANTFYCSDEDRKQQNEVCIEFIHDNPSVHHAWAIKAGDEKPATFFCFSKV